jgi:hypothetical protein
MKKLLIIFLLLITHYSLLIGYAQPVTQEWVARYPGPFNDANGPYLQVDKYGNSYLAGTHVINDSINILCVKYNTSGVQQWAALYKYPGYDYFAPFGLALDSTGNAYVICDYGEYSLGPFSGIMVKFNGMTGSLVWARTHIGDYGESEFRDIKIDRLNNIYVAGTSDSSHLVIRYTTDGDSVWARKYHPPSCSEVLNACTLDDSLNVIFAGKRTHYYTYQGYDSVLVVKYSPGGVLRWESTYGSSYNYGVNWATKIVSDQNGNSYIGGGTDISGYAVYLTLKYDRNGARQWVSIYDASGSGDNNLRSIAMDRINNALFVTGGAVANGMGVAATIKYNSLTGDTVWVRRDTGNYNGGNSKDIVLDSTGNVYIAGDTYNFPSYVPYDILTVKYSSVGNQIWRMSYNGSFNGLDIGRALGLDVSNNVYVLGTSPSSAQVTDYVVVKYNQLSGIKPISSEIPIAFNLKQNYPNPFNPSTRIRFSIPKRSFVELRIYDVLGRLKELALSQYINASEYELTLDCSAYSSGTYFYRMTADGNLIDTKKFVVLK